MISQSSADDKSEILPEIASQKTVELIIDENTIKNLKHFSVKDCSSPYIEGFASEQWITFQYESVFTILEIYFHSFHNDSGIWPSSLDELKKFIKTKDLKEMKNLLKKNDLDTNARLVSIMGNIKIQSLSNDNLKITMTKKDKYGVVVGTLILSKDIRISESISIQKLVVKRAKPEQEN